MLSQQKNILSFELLADETLYRFDIDVFGFSQRTNL